MTKQKEASSSPAPAPAPAPHGARHRFFSNFPKRPFVSPSLVQPTFWCNLRRCQIVRYSLFLSGVPWELLVSLYLTRPFFLISMYLTNWWEQKRNFCYRLLHSGTYTFNARSTSGRSRGNFHRTFFVFDSSKA